MSTGLDIIKASLRLNRALEAGQTPSSEDADDALKALNMMIEAWALERLFVYSITSENFTLVSGTGSYTIGSGATWDTTRPLKIESAFVRKSSIDYPLTIISAKQYHGISQKSLTSSIPGKLYYDATPSTATVYLHPVPTAANDIYLQSRTQLSSLTLAGTVTLPPGYERALKYNLAIEIAPEYSKAVVSEHVFTIARESKAAIKRLNMERQRISSGAAFLGAGGGAYDINSDSYL